MPVRATKRGAERSGLDADTDVLICGASFAGLAAARELAGSGARVLIVDRYEIGERQTSACAAPTEWLSVLGLNSSIRQTFGEIVIHRASRSHRWALPWTWSTFDYPRLCDELASQGEFDLETATVRGVTQGPVHTVHTDRGDLRAPLVVDAMGWRRVLSSSSRTIQPPDAYLSRGLEVHPHGRGRDLELWLDPRYIRPGYSWSFPAGDEVRVGVGSFDPRVGVKRPTVALAEDIDRPLDGYQGNWIPHRLRDSTDDGLFFAGDSAGHCLPATAEGIRTALYFGLACGRELRLVIEGRQAREQALERYGEFSAAHSRWYSWLYLVQRFAAMAMPYPLMDTVLDFIEHPRRVERFFNAYLRIAPPEFAAPR